MKVILLLLSVLVISSALTAVDLETYWEQFKTVHSKFYSSSSEESVRRSTWEKNLAYIHKHNLEADMGKHTFHLGMNEHGDLTDDEYHSYLNGYKMTNTTVTHLSSGTFMSPSNVQTPDSIDWRDKGYVTAVKNQGHCGSCWAFSATGSLEGQHFKKTGKLVSLSEQNLVDCSKKEGNDGCRGGRMKMAFLYVKVNNGLDTETSYPYMAKDEPCHFQMSEVGATDTGFMSIKKDSEEDLLNAVATVGPISVAIDASRKTFRFYKHGVYKDSTCSSTRLDHGVLVVGYGTDMGDKYWLVKNSWGTTFGDNGYIKIARDFNNMCGIATSASYPLV